MRSFQDKTYLLFFTCIVITISLLIVSKNSNFQSSFTRSEAAWDIDKSCTNGGQVECFIYQNSFPGETVILIGDSHMQQYFQEFRKIGQEENINFVYFRNFNELQVRRIKPAVIIISEYHPAVADLKVFESNLLRISSQSISQIYIADNPVFTDYSKFKRYMNPSMLSKFIEKVGFSIKPEKLVDMNQINQNSLSAGRVYSSVAKKFATIIDPITIFCTTEKCRRFQDGRWLFWDDNHLSVVGASLVAVEIRKELLRLIEKTNNQSAKRGGI